MILIASISDINWVNLYRIAYQNELVELGPELLAEVDKSRQHFLKLIAEGTPCYGVTTGLGKLVNTELNADAKAALPANMLHARAAAVGEPFPPAVGRAMMLIRLVNFLSGRSGVSTDLCQALVTRLNQGLTPWVPGLGHGMAADATANTHAFQTLIGEGFVYGADGQREPASLAMAERGLAPISLADREGLALINGICAAPAFAMDAFYQLEKLLALANMVGAVSLEAMAAPKDSIDPALGHLSSEGGVARTINVLRRHLNHSQTEVYKLQAAVSYRIIPQVHGAFDDALIQLRQRIENLLVDCTDNPIMDGDNLLSVGSFHNQHLVNQVEQVALALAHVGSLSERRLHRMMSSDNTGLNAQLAARPGLDAGLVVAHKACIDLSARLRVLAQPVSLFTGDTSAGQEDYMSMAIPAIHRLYEMRSLTEMLLAYELLAGLVALRQRDSVPGDDVSGVCDYFDRLVPPLLKDRSPGPDVETILKHFNEPGFRSLFG
ncbi:MAG: aromatic amino acid ammonia-lyase [Pseudomonadota bacterium]